MKLTASLIALTLALSGTVSASIPLEILFDCAPTATNSVFTSSKWGGCCKSYNTDTGAGVNCRNATLTEETPAYDCDVGSAYKLPACCAYSKFLVLGAHQFVCDSSEVIY